MSVARRCFRHGFVRSLQFSHYGICPIVSADFFSYCASVNNCCFVSYLEKQVQHYFEVPAFNAANLQRE